MALTKADKGEVATLAVVTAAVAIFARSLSHRVALADLLLCGAVFLLVQGLVRDVVRLARERKREAASPSPAVQCVCMESTLGVGAIVAGSVLLFAWTPVIFSVSRVAWPLGVAALGTFGFLTKDVVFDWRQRRFGRDATHAGRLPAARADVP